jgi:hypothetical protein
MSDVVRRLRLQLPRRAHLSCRTIEAEAADEIEKLERSLKYAEQLIYESGLRLGEMSRACAELRAEVARVKVELAVQGVAAFEVNERLREENDIMRRHLNLHPDKPLGNELRAENERLRLRVKFLEDELKCPAALEPKP